MHRLSRFLALQSSQRRLLFHAFVALSLCAAALRLGGFRRLQGLLARLPTVDGRRAGRSGMRSDAVAITAWAVGVAARHGPVRCHCLEQALALWWLLRRQHVDSNIRFGARRQDDRLEAHAWVEFDGGVFSAGPDDDPAFVPFTRAAVPLDGRQ